MRSTQACENNATWRGWHNSTGPACSTPQLQCRPPNSGGFGTGPRRCINTGTGDAASIHSASVIAYPRPQPPTKGPAMRTALPAALLLSILPAASAAEKEELFAARPLTAENAFTAGIEGPACDKAGNVFAVNFEKQQTVGKVTPDGKGEVWLTLPGKSVGNGIVFDRKGLMYVAD